MYVFLVACDIIWSQLPNVKSYFVSSIFFVTAKYYVINSESSARLILIQICSIFHCVKIFFMTAKYYLSSLVNQESFLEINRLTLVYIS